MSLPRPPPLEAPPVAGWSHRWPSWSAWQRCTWPFERWRTTDPGRPWTTLDDLDGRRLSGGDAGDGWRRWTRLRTETVPTKCRGGGSFGALLTQEDPWWRYIYIYIIIYGLYMHSHKQTGVMVAMCAGSFGLHIYIYIYTKIIKDCWANIVIYTQRMMSF